MRPTFREYSNSTIMSKMSDDMLEHLRLVYLGQNLEFVSALYIGLLDTGIFQGEFLIAFDGFNDLIF